MKKLFILICAAASFASCKKNKETAAAPLMDASLKKLISVENQIWGNAKYIFSYNANGFIASASEPTYTGNFVNAGAVFTYTYTSKATGKKAVEFLNSTKDAAGRVTSFTANYYNADGVTLSNTYQVTLTYNAGGYLTLSTWVSNNNTYKVENTWLNSNLTRVTNYTNGSVTEIDEYEYHTDKANKTQVDFFETFILGLKHDKTFGKFSKNLLKSVKVFNNNNVLQQHETFAYTFDADGYPLQLALTNVSSGFVSNFTFTFQ